MEIPSDTITIRQISFFSGLSREDLARIAGKLEEERFSAGRAIVRQGEAGDALYAVQSGAVEVVLESDGSVESVAVLGPNEFFGEMSLFTGQKRSATVLALVDSVVLKLSKEHWEELLTKHPSLSFHFCKVLSRRLAETDREIAKGRGAFNLVMEEFFAAQPGPVQGFLIRTSVLRTIDLGAIESALTIRDASKLLATLASTHPMFLRRDQKGQHTYPDYLRDFLSAKLGQTAGKKERNDLHRRFALYFSKQGQWASAIYHSIKAEAWEEALELFKAHGNEMLEHEPPGELRALLEAIPAQPARSHGHITRLKAEVYVRLGNLDTAIHSYQEFLAQKQVSAAESFEVAQYYHELAELHQKKGEVGEALGCLRMGASMVEEGRADLEAVEAMHSIEFLQQKSGKQQGALDWGRKAFNVAEKLGPQARRGILAENKKSMGLILALGAGWIIWHIAPPPPLDERGVHLLAGLTVAIILWGFDVFDQHTVTLALLLSWLLFGIVPTELALAGFSKGSWFFMLGVLGIGAAVTRSGLLYRVALQVLRRIPPSYKIYTFVLTASGLLVTPLLPDDRARVAIMSPLSQAISETIGFRSRSNGSAGLGLAAYVGFSQIAFLFLTGSSTCLIGWNLMPENARSEFGWGTWVVAAFPAGIFTLLFLYAAIVLLFRVKERVSYSPKTLKTQLEILGPLTRGEWVSIIILGLALAGWSTKMVHGISEAWIAVGALLAFLLTGVLDKPSFKNNIDWGFLIFFGIISSLGAIMSHLHLDRWLKDVVAPFLAAVSFHPLPFLITIALSVYAVRLIINKTPGIFLLTISLVPIGQDMGIHPGVLLLTILMAIDSWFLPYQTINYQIAYYSTDEKAFSHAQARKLMVAKFVASLLAIAISVPYWRMLGFIR